MKHVDSFSDIPYRHGDGAHPAWTEAMRRHTRLLQIETVGTTVVGTVTTTGWDPVIGQTTAPQDLVIDALVWHNLAFVRVGEACYVQPLPADPTRIGAMQLTGEEQNAILMQVCSTWLTTRQRVRLPPL